MIGIEEEKSNELPLIPVLAVESNLLEENLRTPHRTAVAEAEEPMETPSRFRRHENALSGGDL